MEETLTHKVVYENKSYQFCVDSVRLPNGHEGTREFVRHPGGVAVLAINEKEEIALVKQYRYAIGMSLLEIPAGKLDKIPGEDVLDAAKRELREETGLLAEEWIEMGSITPSPGIVSEVLHLFLAKSLTQTHTDLDEDEFIQVVWENVQEVQDQILRNECLDIKTMCALFKASLLGLLPENIQV